MGFYQQVTKQSQLTLLTKEMAAEPTSDQWTTHQQLVNLRGIARGFVGGTGIAVERYPTQSHSDWSCRNQTIKGYRDENIFVCYALLCEMHIFFFSGDLRLQNPARLYIIFRQSWPPGNTFTSGGFMTIHGVPGKGASSRLQT